MNLATHTEVNNLTTMREEAIAQFERFRTLARRTVREAWHAGKALSGVRDATEHGEWYPWLDESGISKRMAQRLIQLYSGHEMRQLDAFDSVDAALKALPKPQTRTEPEPEPEPEPVADDPPKLTPSEKRLMEMDALKEQAKEAEERARAAEQRAEEAEQARTHAESELKVQDGYQKGRDVLTERQEEVRQLKHRIGELESECTSLKREVHGLKRALKEKDRQLRDLAANKQMDGEELPF